MGDLETLAKARRELEDLYLGVPDDSVNLTFEDLSEVRPHKHHNSSFSSSSSDKKMNSQKEVMMTDIPKKEEPLLAAPLAKLPSLDFSRAFENTVIQNNHHINTTNHNFHQNHHRPQNHVHHVMDHSYDSHSTSILHGHTGHTQHHLHHGYGHNHAMDGHGHGHVAHGHNHAGHAAAGGHHHHHHHGTTSPYGSHHHHAGRMHVVGNSSMAYYDDMSQMSGISKVSMGGAYPGGHRRQGIPHSNICTVCSNYIYIFRHRCLVCGRVYCRQCVRMGMGEMPEGRKCVKCLGKRFSQRYIKRAGQMGCCMGYPSNVKQQELIWAEKGPRRVVENGPGRSSMMSTTRSPVPISPVMAHSASNPPSFMMGSPYSPYSSTHHPLPL